jgi:hypothetical protein
MRVVFPGTNPLIFLYSLSNKQYCMSTQEDLLLELTILKAQIHNIVYKRLQKVAVRWLLVT